MQTMLPAKRATAWVILCGETKGGVYQARSVALPLSPSFTSANVVGTAAVPGPSSPQPRLCHFHS